MNQVEKSYLEIFPGDESGSEIGESTSDLAMAVECICPKCGVNHAVNFRWIGRGTPRIFCRSCKRRIG